MNDGYVLVFAVAVALAFLFADSMKPKPVPEEPTEEETPDFEYLTVREQMQKAQETSDALGDMEQLVTDLETCSTDDIKVLHVEWLGEDGRNHEYDLYADGSNTVTECITAIAEREIAELRRSLAYQCAALKKRTRRAKNCAQNGSKQRGRGE